MPRKQSFEAYLKSKFGTPSASPTQPIDVPKPEPKRPKYSPSHLLDKSEGNCVCEGLVLGCRVSPSIKTPIILDRKMKELGVFWMDRAGDTFKIGMCESCRWLFMIARDGRKAKSGWIKQVRRTVHRSYAEILAEFDENVAIIMGITEVRRKQAESDVYRLHGDMLQIRLDTDELELTIKGETYKGQLTYVDIRRVSSDRVVGITLSRERAKE